jgi:nucleotide-binding universal stress UspA family protein
LDKELEMSTFPAKILLATDGSDDSVLAARAAVDLANDTGAELRVAPVDEARQVYPPATSGPRSARAVEGGTPPGGP